MINSPVDEHLNKLLKKNPETYKAYLEFLSEYPVQVQLAIRRRERMLSQRTVAKRMKIPQPHIARIERKSHDPRLSSVTKEAKALGCRLLVVPVEELKRINGMRQSHR